MYWWKSAHVPLLPEGWIGITPPGIWTCNLCLISKILYHLRYSSCPRPCFPKFKLKCSKCSAKLLSVQPIWMHLISLDVNCAIRDIHVKLVRKNSGEVIFPLYGTSESHLIQRFFTLWEHALGKTCVQSKVESIHLCPLNSGLGKTVAPIVLLNPGGRHSSAMESFHIRSHGLWPRATCPVVGQTESLFFH